MGFFGPRLGIERPIKSFFSGLGSDNFGSKTYGSGSESGSRNLVLKMAEFFTIIGITFLRVILLHSFGISTYFSAKE